MSAGGHSTKGRTINFGCGLRDTIVSHAKFCTREARKVKERNYLSSLNSHQTECDFSLENIEQMRGRGNQTTE